MTKFATGDDVIIEFKGVEVPGEVIRQSNGWVMAVVEIDPVIDWGRVGPQLDPHSTVCVPDARVRHAKKGE